MNQSIFTLILVVSITACTHSQNPSTIDYRLIGGPCEGCEAVLEHPGHTLSAVDTLPGFEAASNRIKVSGTVYQPDGQTPAEGVILYLYHTNQAGIYPTNDTTTGWANQHGYIRDWIQTDSNGQYAFYTFRPSSYPSGTIPAHIHITILEPDGKYYWLGSYHFADDPLLSADERNPRSPRGGSTGVLDLQQEGTLLTGTRDIVLGANVPNYK